MKKNKYNYPIAPSKPVTEDYFGTKITDHYRNLEDLKNPEVQAWLKAQGKYAKNILENIPGRDRLIKQMEDLHQRQTFKISNINVTKDNQCFFLKKQRGAKSAQVCYRRTEQSEDELLFDPKDYKPETQKNYVIQNISPSWDGRYLVIAITHSGIEFGEMIILDLKTGKFLPHVITHAYTDITWFPNNNGFVYRHCPVIDVNSKELHNNTKLVRYRIGDDPKQLDIFFSKDTHPQLDITHVEGVYIHPLDPLDKYILGGIYRTSTPHVELYYTSVDQLEDGIPDWKPLLKAEDQARFGKLNGNTYVYSTVKNAPNGEIRSITIGKKSIGNSTLLVNTETDAIIDNFALTSEGLYFTRVKNGVESKLYLLQNGKEINIPLDRPAGSIALTAKGVSYSDLSITITGWLNPPTRYKYINKQLIEANIGPSDTYPEFEDFVVKEVLVKSHDGEEVPLSIIHQKGIELDGQHPTLMNGYGSNNYSIPPRFDPFKILVWVAQGGIYCVAHVRGGGEKGEAWFQAGRKAHKPNTWKDFIACTEYLISENYTCQEKMAIEGASAGGILIGRAMTARPDLYTVAIARVGVMNALRKEKAPNNVMSILNCGISTDPIECKGLIEMDAYLQLQEGVNYPATLITAGINDPRVSAWQPGKFAAKLQVYNASDKPIIFGVDHESGHGYGNTTSKIIEKFANMYAFAFWQLGHPDYQLE